MIVNIDSIMKFEEGWRVVYSNDINQLLDNQLPCSGYFYTKAKLKFKVGDQVSISFRKIKK